MGFLSTHILDTAHGCPAENVNVVLKRITDQGAEVLTETVTNSDGRTDKPILEGEAFKKGQYELTFSIGDYFRGKVKDLEEPAFVDEVVLRFGVAQPEEHYHVPLLASPYSYSTYRGS